MCNFLVRVFRARMPQQILFTSNDREVKKLRGDIPKAARRVDVTAGYLAKLL